SAQRPSEVRSERRVSQLDSGPDETPLADLIARYVRRHGPLSVHRFMDLALNHPRHGYYRSSQPIGAQGDFVTAPEISQMFGELLGIWVVAQWQSMGAPEAVRLVELGPGRGTLMADALRVIQRQPQLVAALNAVGTGSTPASARSGVQLIEANSTLRATQRAALQGMSEQNDGAFPVSWPSWGEATGQRGEMATIVIANELLDVVPIHQVVARQGTWTTRAVGLGAPDGLAFVDGVDAGPALPTPAEIGVQDGEVAEFRDWANEPIFSGITGLLRGPAPAIGLFIDYGSFLAEMSAGASLLSASASERALEPGPRHGAMRTGPSAIGTRDPGALRADNTLRLVRADTLQAMRHHAPCGPLAAPGRSDLTAQVDFNGFAQAACAAGCLATPAMTQAEFLARLGLVERLQALSSGARPEQRQRLEGGAARLLAPQGMGGRFWAMAVAGPGSERLTPPFPFAQWLAEPLR
ncbi:MAG: SAM-dependent methyltransferase, partial [Pseudomonadota bacterium]